MRAVRAGPSFFPCAIGVLNLQIPSLAKERFEKAVGLLVVAEAPFVRVPHQLSRNAEGDRTQREPLDVFRRDREVRYARGTALTGANPVLLVIDAALEQLRRQFVFRPPRRRQQPDAFAT